MKRKNNPDINDAPNYIIPFFDDAPSDTEKEPKAEAPVAVAENAVAEEASDGLIQPYVPCFTEASENYRLQNDKKIRAQLGIGDDFVAEKVDIENPDAITLDSTAEFEEDVNGAPAKTPENVAVDESDESISVYKFEPVEEELDEETLQEVERINQLLRPDSKQKTPDETKTDVEPEPTVEAETTPDFEPQGSDEAQPKDEPSFFIPNPENSGFGVFDSPFTIPTAKADDLDIGNNSDEEESDFSFIKEKEYTNPAERESFKDKFLDSILSKKIRRFFSLIFMGALFLLEILASLKVIGSNIFPGAASSTLGIVDFLLAACIFALTLPEIFRAFGYLLRGRLILDFIPLMAFILLGGYTVAVVTNPTSSYALFGFLFAVVTLPVLNASLYRTKGDFIAFKMISKNDEKQVVELKNTRELELENMSLDGYVDEYKSKTIRTHCAEFVSDFFKNSSKEPVTTGEVAVAMGAPLAIGLISAIVSFFLAPANAPIVATGVFALVFMLGCPVFSVLSGKVSFFHSQRAALQFDSTAVGEVSYDKFSSADVITFNDTDIFGPDDVNLKRFMLYCDRENMDKVMSQMCALFASVGGPLDFIFSNAIDNRVRHKTATEVIIEDDGLSGIVAGRRIFAGSEEYMRRNRIAIPQSAISSESNVGIDTTKVMYAAENGEVTAKFYIRYSFSEEFTMILPELRESQIIPLIYTRDPNISNELLRTLTASGYDCMRVCKVYRPIEEEKLHNRFSAGFVTYGDRIDAASMVLLARKYRGFAIRSKFVELCAMIMGIILAIVFSIVGMQGAATIVAAAWQIILCLLVRAFSYKTFLKQDKEQEY